MRQGSSTGIVKAVGNLPAKSFVNPVSADAVFDALLLLEQVTGFEDLEIEQRPDEITLARGNESLRIFSFTRERTRAEAPSRRATKQRTSVPVHVDASIRKALEKVPADRFRGVRDFAAALSEVLS